MARPAGARVAIRRRTFLSSSVLGALAVSTGCQRDDAQPDRRHSTASTAVDSAHEALSRRQPGITTPPSAFGLFTTFNVTGHSRIALARLLEDLTDRIAGLNSQGPSSGADSGRTMMVAIGSSVFDERFGLQHLRPRHLTAMPSFPNDALEPRYCHGDLLIQVDANHEKVVRQAVDDLHKAAIGRLRPVGRLRGSAPRMR